MTKLNQEIRNSFELYLISSLNIDIDFDNFNNDEIFISLLNNSVNNISNYKAIYFMNKLLQNISVFNDICMKYFKVLTDSFKNQINQKNIDNTALLLILNSLSNFIKIFSYNQEKYNEKHKNILKQFPNFIQLLSKFYSQKIYSSKKILESYLILFLTFIEFYPTLIRNYQNFLEKIIKSTFYNYITAKNYENISLVHICSVIYTNLYKLSPNMINRHNDYVENIVNNIKYYLEYFRPKMMEENNIDNNNNIVIEEKNNFFIVDKNNIIDSKNIIVANKVMEVLFILLNDIFKYMQLNIYFEVNFNIIFSLINDILTSYENIINKISSPKNQISMIVFNGLSNANYKLFLLYINKKILNYLIYLISNYSRYIYCFNIFFSKIINKLLLNEKLFQDFSFHEIILDFFCVIITHFIDIFPEEVDLIIYKHLYNTFPLLYLNYLQNNDKSIIKVNDLYFKSSFVKNKIKDNNSLNNEENRKLILKNFEILKTYCKNCKKIKKIGNKNILSGIIDLIILPPFAKFVFNIDYEIKNNIIDVIEICLQKNLIIINKSKLYQFLNNFYFYDGNLKYKAENLIEMLNLNDTQKISNLDNNEINNICGLIFDFNKKLKEYLLVAEKKFENLDKKNDDNTNYNNIEDNKNEEIDIEEEKMLNKKRKINQNMEERKGNKRKNNYLAKNKEKKIQKKEKDENLDIISNEIISEKKNEEDKEKLNDKINIDEEDINIPDIF